MLIMGNGRCGLSKILCGTYCLGIRAKAFQLLC